MQAREGCQNIDQIFAAPALCYGNTDGGKDFLVVLKIIFKYTQIR